MAVVRLVVCIRATIVSVDFVVVVVVAKSAIVENLANCMNCFLEMAISF